MPGHGAMQEGDDNGLAVWHHEESPAAGSSGASSSRDPSPSGGYGYAAGPSYGYNGQAAASPATSAPSWERVDCNRSLSKDSGDVHDYAQNPPDPRDMSPRSELSAKQLHGGHGTLQLPASHNPRTPVTPQAPAASPGYVRPTLQGVLESPIAGGHGSPPTWETYGAGVGLEASPEDDRYDHRGIGIDIGGPDPQSGMYAEPPGGINASAGHGQDQLMAADARDVGPMNTKLSSQRSGMSRVGSQEPEWAPGISDPHCWAVLAYNVFAFFALFFAPAFFDYDGDGDFDQADVDKFLQDKVGMRPTRKAQERKQRRTLGTTRLRIIDAKKGLGDPQFNSSPTSDQQTRTTEEQRFANPTTEDQQFLEEFVKVCIYYHENDQEKLMAMLQEMLDLGVAMARNLAEGLADPRTSKIFIFGEVNGKVDGEGDVDIRQFLLSPMPGVDKDGNPRPQSDLVKIQKKMQAGNKEVGWPIFTLFHSLLVLALWIGEAVRSNQDFTSASAGLNSLYPGQFDMRMYRTADTECEDLRFEVWRWYTYQYTHNGLAHVGTNIGLTLILGIPLEGIHGTLRLWLMYNVGVFGGAFACLLASVHTGVVGESGGVYALLGMHFSDLVMNWSSNGTPKPFRWATLLFLLALAASDFLVWYSEDDENGAPGSSHSAHFGGCAAGILIAIITLKNDEETRFERVLIGCAWFVGAALTVFAIAHGPLQWPPRSISDGVPWCWTRQVWDPEIFGDSEWHCIRCGEQACIDAWLALPNTYPVSTKLCQTIGWFYEEPQLPP